MTNAGFRRFVAIAFWLTLFVVASGVTLTILTAIHFVIRFW